MSSKNTVKHLIELIFFHNKRNLVRYHPMHNNVENISASKRSIFHIERSILILN